MLSHCLGQTTGHRWSLDLCLFQPKTISGEFRSFSQRDRSTSSSLSASQGCTVADHSSIYHFWCGSVGYCRSFLSSFVYPGHTLIFDQLCQRLHDFKTELRTDNMEMRNCKVEMEKYNLNLWSGCDKSRLPLLHFIRQLIISVTGLWLVICRLTL